MTDRELLEKAAKAAGYEIHVWGTKGAENFGRMDMPNHPRWNPLTDDGDALRLAVKLLLRIEHDAAYQQNQDRNTKVRVLAEHQQLIVGYGNQGKWQKEWHETDPYAATRRAIVRAAAAIGETL